jgi:hypothetical protein
VCAVRRRGEGELVHWGNERDVDEASTSVERRDSTSSCGSLWASLSF